MLTEQLHKQHIRKHFNKAASSYDNACSWHHHAADQLHQYLAQATSTPLETLADIGAGTGKRHTALSTLAQTVVALDAAEHMLKHAAGARICCDFDNLACFDNSFDAIYANLSIQWSLNLSATLHAWKRILKPSGLLAFSTLASHTLQELRSYWQDIDDATHVNSFLSTEAITAAVQQAGLTPLLQTQQLFRTEAPSLYAHMKNLQHTGANYVQSPKAVSKPARQALKQLIQLHHQQPQTTTCTFEVVYVIAKN